MEINSKETVMAIQQTELFNCTVDGKLGTYCDALPWEDVTEVKLAFDMPVIEETHQPKQW